MSPAVRIVTLLVTVALSTACQGTVSCGPCPPPVYVNVATEALASGTVVTVCLRAACRDVIVDPEGTGDRRTSSLGLDTGLSPKEVDGAEVTAEAITPDGGRAGTRARLEYREGGGGECSCTSAHADLVFSPLNQTMTPAG